jgi:hypothetical protein
MPRAVEPRPAQTTARDLRTAVAIFAAALALRLLFLFRSADAAWPHSALYEGDAPVWARWAKALGRGEPFEFDLPMRPPGMAWLLRWLGADAVPFTGTKVLWCAISAATVALLWLVLARWFTRRAAWIAAALLAVSFGSFELATSLNNEAPYALLVTAIVGATLAWCDRPQWRWALALGLLNGAALLLRAEHALLVVLLLAYGAWRVRGAAGLARAAAQAVLAGAVALACCVPWMVRSHEAAQRFNTVPMQQAPYRTATPRWTPEAEAYMESLPAFVRADNFAMMSMLGQKGGAATVQEADVRGFFAQGWGYVPEPVADWSLVSMKGGLDFALANHPLADGGFTRAGLGDVQSAAPEFAFARPSHLRMLNHGYAMGWEWIAADPGRWRLLVREKLQRFADGITLGLFVSDWPYAGLHERRPVDVVTPVRGQAYWWQALVLALLAGGTVAALRVRGGGSWVLVVLYKVLVTVAFYGYARQATSIAPATFAVIALGIDAAIGMVMARPGAGLRWAGAAIGVALVAAAAWSAWLPPSVGIRTLRPEGKMMTAPEWGEGAFESTDWLVIERDGGN